jgi:hypothetical protein
MESSSEPTPGAMTSGATATVTPVLTTLTMLNPAGDGDVCGVDGVCL